MFSRDSFFIDAVDFSSPAHDVFGRYETSKTAAPSFFSTPHDQQPLSHPRPSSTDRQLLAASLGHGAVNPQSASTLYSNYFPQEIRDLIFEYAATPDPSGEPRAANPKVSIALLLTCRRTYLETFHLPPLLTSHTFTHPSPFPSAMSTTPAAKLRPESSHFPEEAYFSSFAPQQLSMVKSLTLQTHQSFLSHPEKGLAKLLAMDYLKGIQQLRIEVRYCDWEGWERYLGMELDPGETKDSPEADEEGDIEMLEEEKSPGEQNVQQEPLQPDWGRAFASLPNLISLSLSLESSSDRSASLDTVVRKAQSWIFPLSADPQPPRRVLSTKGGGLDGLVVGKHVYAGPEEAWADFCPACCGRSDDWTACEERRVRRRAGQGPMMESRVVQWGVAHV